MKIVQKTVVANLFYIVLIALIGFFAYQNVNLVLTKFHFVEIADDLNATFLEMRLSEKNFFLYRDNKALDAIKDKLDYALKMIQHARMDIIKATGVGNFARLKDSLEKYQTAIDRVKILDSGDLGVQHRIREAGRELRDYSEQITHLERANVNRIIADSRRWLFYSLVVFVLTAIGVSHFLFLKILHSLKKIEEVAHSISEGNFSKVESNIPADEVGAAIKAINAMSDELKNREEQIIQSRKLASIGILTAGVAHELGNPLNNISMLAQTGQYLDESLEHTERLEYLKNIEAETERIQEIVKNLLDFSKPRKANLKPTDLNGLIQKTLKLVQNMITVSNLDLGLDLAPDLPMVFIDLNQIQEVLINLITNAAQVCVPGDRVSIATRLSEKKGFLEVDIADTGAGISPQQLPHIFDPFFSTKGADGTGLGLSISYGIVKNHNGAILVKSEVGVGTTFTVELPIYTEQEKAKK
jgi:two-component system, NtrC family, sensor kinase